MKAHQQDSKVVHYVLGLLLLVPLTFGGVEPWSMYLMEMASALTFMFWALQEFLAPASIILWNPVFAPMLMFAALAVLQVAAGKTVYAHASHSTLLLYIAYGFLSFLMVQGLRRTSQLRRLALAFSWYGGGVALFALLQGLASNGKLYWLRAPTSGGWIYGPYVNHNHYAGLMELLFPIPLVLSLGRHARREMRSLAMLASAVMGVTVFLSGSRGGSIALVCEASVLLVALTRQESRIPFRGGLGIAVLAVASLALVALIGEKPLIERLISVPLVKDEIGQGMRLQIDQDLVKMVRRGPLLGWGLGTFTYVYPQYKSFYTDVYVNAAHNDYLQLLTEAGVPGFVIMLWFLSLVLGVALRKARSWSTDINGAVALAAMAGIIGILVHSLVDFNLQIPANAALFYVLCVIATLKTRFESHRRRKS